MATVYKAMQPSLGRYVALKVLPPYFAHDEEFVSRFRHEALAVAKLRHPNIVQVYNFHQEGDLFYLAMEYIDGGSLSDLLRIESPLPLNAAVSFARQIAEALYHAHKKGFVHRDIKPSNILLTSERQAVLTDFGITKAMEGTRLTKTTNLGAGTSEYMSPEQAKGIQVDQRSDLYSLGVVLFEMLTGRCPFEGGNPLAVIHSQIYDPPPKPTDLNPGIPREVENLILKLLEKEPDSRFRDGLELVAGISKLKLLETPDAVIDNSPTLTKSTLEGASTKLKPAPMATKVKLKVKEPPTRIKSQAKQAVVDEATEAARAAAKPTFVSKKKAEPLKEKRTKIGDDKQDKKSALTPAGKAAKSSRAGAPTNKVKATQVKQAKVERGKTAAPAKQVVANPEPIKPDRRPGSRRLALMLSAAGFLALSLIFLAVWSIFGGQAAFHYQFPPTAATAGGAVVTREVNIQSDARSSAYVVALRVKGGKGDIEVRESIPKSVTSSVRNIKFNIPPAKLISGDPVVMWKLKPKSEVTAIIYRVPAPKNLTQKQFDRLMADYAALPRLARIKVSPESIAVAEGQSVGIKAVGIMSDESTAANISFSWRSTNTELAAVDENGKLRAIKFGKLDLMVNSGRVKTVIRVTVLPVLKSLTLSPDGATAQAGNTVQFNATGRMSDGSTVNSIGLTWTSSDNGIGSVDGSGVFSARSPGQATITARSGTIAASTLVTVTPIPAAPPSPPKRRVSSGGSISGGDSGPIYSGGALAPSLNAPPSGSSGDSGSSGAPITINVP